MQKKTCDYDQIKRVISVYTIRNYLHQSDMILFNEVK